MKEKFHEGGHLYKALGIGNLKERFVKKLPEETIVIAKILFRLQGINLVMHKILKGLLQVGDQIN